MPTNPAISKQLRDLAVRLSGELSAAEHQLLTTAARLLDTPAVHPIYAQFVR